MGAPETGINNTASYRVFRTGLQPVIITPHCESKNQATQPSLGELTAVRWE